jgi:hypothetical protein
MNDGVSKPTSPPSSLLVLAAVLAVVLADWLGGVPVFVAEVVEGPMLLTSCFS